MFKNVSLLKDFGVPGPSLKMVGFQSVRLRRWDVVNVSDQYDSVASATECVRFCFAQWILPYLILWFTSSSSGGAFQHAPQHFLKSGQKMQPQTRKALSLLPYKCPPSLHRFSTFVDRLLSHTKFGLRMRARSLCSWDDRSSSSCLSSLPSSLRSLYRYDLVAFDPCYRRSGHLHKLYDDFINDVHQLHDFFLFFIILILPCW